MIRRVLLIVIALTFLGCSSTKVDVCSQCPPKLDTQIVKEATPCINKISVLADLLLPDRPKPPPEDASEEELKAWLKDLRDAIETREAMQDARIKALEHLIETHNLHGPLCSEITPTE